MDPMPLSSEKRGLFPGVSPKKSSPASPATRIPSTPGEMRMNTTGKRAAAASPVGRTPVASSASRRSPIAIATATKAKAKATSPSIETKTRPKSASPLKKKTTVVKKKKKVGADAEPEDGDPIGDPIRENRGDDSEDAAAVDTSSRSIASPVAATLASLRRSLERSDAELTSAVTARERSASELERIATQLANANAIADALRERLHAMDVRRESEAARLNESNDAWRARADDSERRLAEATVRIASLERESRESKELNDARRRADAEANERRVLALAEANERRELAERDADATRSLLAATRDAASTLERSLASERDESRELAARLAEARAETAALRERARLDENRVRDAESIARAAEVRGPAARQVADARREELKAGVKAGRLKAALDAERKRSEDAIRRADDASHALRVARKEAADERRARKEMEADVDGWSAAVAGREEQIEELRRALDERDADFQDTRSRLAETRAELAASEARVRASRAHNDALIAELVRVRSGLGGHRGYNRDSVTSLPGFGSPARSDFAPRSDSGRTTPVREKGDDVDGSAFVESGWRWDGIERGGSPRGAGGSPRAAPRTGWE